MSVHNPSWPFLTTCLSSTSMAQAKQECQQRTGRVSYVLRGTPGVQLPPTAALGDQEVDLTDQLGAAGIALVGGVG
jgi:hypothetical protein